MGDAEKSMQTHLLSLQRQLRGNMPAPELILWQKIRDRQLGVRFRRQYVSGARIFDFYVPEIKLALEIDGDSHFLNPADRLRELNRDKQLADTGVTVLRFTNSDVMKNLPGVIASILAVIAARQAYPPLHLPPAHRGEKKVVALLLAIIFISLPLAASAAIVPPECREGLARISECGLPSLIGVFVRIAQFIFGIAGSIALIMFVWGGFKWLTAAGESTKIQEGKEILTNTVIALFIIFGAYVGVQFLVTAIVGGPTSAPLVEGQQCFKDANAKNSAAGTAFRVGGALKCVATCADLSDDGYQEKTPDPTLECIQFPDSPPGKQCCRGR